MITREQALTTSIFHEEGPVDADSGRCVVWRVSGPAAFWGTGNEHFSVPVTNDLGATGALVEGNEHLFHAEDDCPRGYVSDARSAFEAGQRAAFDPMPDTSRVIAFEEDPDEVYPALDQQEYLQRTLRHQLDDKLDEIQQALGLTDLAMLEVVAHWMRYKTRQLRDAEVEAAQR